MSANSTKVLTIALWKLRRIGVFSIPPSGKNKCGGVSVRHFNYDLTLKMKEGKKLDRQGFLVDHNYINDIINRAAANMAPVSCERLCKNLTDIINKAIPGISTIEITVSGGPFGFVSLITNYYY